MTEENLESRTETKVFGDGFTPARETLPKMLLQSYLPLGSEETLRLVEEQKIPFQLYATGEVFVDNVQRRANLDELKDIELFYRNGGRLVCVSFGECRLLNYFGLEGVRFVGKYDPHIQVPTQRDSTELGDKL